MRNFLSLKSDSFGMSISDSAVRIAKLKKKGRFFTLASWAQKELDSEIFEEGQLKNEEMFLKCLKETLQDAQGDKIKTNNIIFSLPETKAFFTVLQMPLMSDEELKTAIPLEAENYIPFQMQEVYSDFQVIKPMKDHLDHIDVLLAVIPKAVVDPYIKCFKKINLIPLALEIESQSLCRALIKNESSQFPVLIINFEERAANLSVFSGFSLRLTTSIPVSSYKINQSIAKALGVGAKEAEVLKLKYGLRMGNKYPQRIKIVKDEAVIEKISEALIPVLSDFAGQVKKYISYYKSHASHQHLYSESNDIEKIIISGKEANTIGLAQFFSLSFDIPVEAANPWVNILPEPIKEVPSLSLKESLSYAASFGLALRGMKEKII